MDEEHEDYNLASSWEWKGFSFKIKSKYRSVIGLVDGEVVARHETHGAVSKKLYDHGKYLESKNPDQNTYNCPFDCEFEHENVETWEKHIHKEHKEELLDEWYEEIREGKEEKKPISEIDIENDSLEEVRDIVSYWGSYKCHDDSLRGFSPSLLKNHMIEEHPEKIFHNPKN